MTKLGQTINNYPNAIIPLKNGQTLYKIHGNVSSWFGRYGKGLQESIGQVII